MPFSPSSDAPADRRAPFSCRWRDERDGAAWIQVSGELDPAASRQLAGVLLDALGSAHVLLLDVREVSFGDCSGLDAVLDAAGQARAEAHRPA